MATLAIRLSRRMARWRNRRRQSGSVRTVTWAASTSRKRSRELPCLLMWPSRRRSPLDSSDGTSPTLLAICLPQPKRSGVPMTSSNASAVNGPTPGWVISRRATGRFSTSTSTARVSSWIFAVIWSSNSNRSCRRRLAHRASTNDCSWALPAGRHSAFLRDAEGKLLGHIVRKFDAEGRIVAEEQFADAPHDFVLPEEIRSNLNPGQIKAVGAFAASVENRANSYSYDAQGRVTERHRSGGPFGDEVTITNYNDHGDKASERTTTVMNPEAGRQYTVSEAGTTFPVGQPPPPQPPAVYETQYTHQYDAYGNWTELTTAGRSDPGAPFAPGSVRRRKLTYY